MATRQDPNPFLARIPEGPIRSGLDLAWRKLAQLKDQIPAGALSLSTTPAISLYLSAPFSIPDAVDTKIQWSLVGYQSNAAKAAQMFTTTFPTRLTIPRDTPPGSIWAAIGQVQFDNNANNQRSVQLLYTDSGVSNNPFGGLSLSALGGGFVQNVHGVGFLMDPAAGSYVELFGFQNSGGALNALDTGSFLQLVRIF